MSLRKLLQGGESWGRCSSSTSIKPGHGPTVFQHRKPAIRNRFFPLGLEDGTAPGTKVCLPLLQLSDPSHWSRSRLNRPFFPPGGWLRLEPVPGQQGQVPQPATRQRRQFAASKGGAPERLLCAFCSPFLWRLCNAIDRADKPYTEL